MREASERLGRFLLNLNTPAATARGISDLINISVDSVYRRLRGEASFTLEEAILIANHFQISLDALSSSSQNVFGSYRFRPLYQNEENLIENIQSISKLIGYFNRQEGNLTYVAEALPIFRVLAPEHLGRFVLFYWKKVILNYTSHRATVFDQDYALSLDERDSIDHVTKAYFSSNITEIWTNETIQKMLFQIEYAVESGFILSIKTLQNLYGDFKELLKEVFDMARSQENKNAGHFELFDCEIQLENNCVFTEFDDTAYCFLNFNNFNSVSMAESEFTQEVGRWIDNLKAKSVKISGQAEKRRNQFFIAQKAKIESSFLKCEKFLSDSELHI